MRWLAGERASGALLVDFEGNRRGPLPARGKASLTLRRNGDVILRGVDIRTEAEQVQCIKCGKVQIN